MRSCGTSPSAGASPSPPCWALWTPSWGWVPAAIGGKDSMSGSFLDMDVPPTLISFAIAPIQGRRGPLPEFKEAGHPVYLFRLPGDTEEAAWEPSTPCVRLAR